jgi:hypothetical protein
VRTASLVWDMVAVVAAVADTEHVEGEWKTRLYIMTDNDE